MGRGVKVTRFLLIISIWAPPEGGRATYTKSTQMEFEVEPALLDTVLRVSDPTPQGGGWQEP
jgi:hypothetical protein